MIRLNRTTEYGLIALRHMNGKRDLTSAREIADQYGLPFEITAKTLQRLKDKGLIGSEQGSRGGYTLQRELSSVTLAEFLEMMEGPQAIVECGNEHSSCSLSGRCEIKGMLGGLNRKMAGFLMGIRLNELDGFGTVNK